MKKYYEILGLEEGASKEEIDRRYKQLSEELNPKNNDNQDFFKEEYAKVQEAYKILIKEALLTKNNANSDTNSKDEVNENESKTDNPKNLKPLKNKQMYFVDKIKLILGISLICFSLLGIVVAISYQFDLDWFKYGNHSRYNYARKVFGGYSEGSASNLPFFYGFMGLAGSILLSSVKYDK
tara:strand:+ start:105 stop:647 length:543 start_codon:yes stop_codon:yes gene_type:complete